MLKTTGSGSTGLFVVGRTGWRCLDALSPGCDAYGPVAELADAVCFVVPKLAAVAVPLRFRLTLTGSDKAKSPQLRLP
jgi:hypothetical protein